MALLCTFAVLYVSAADNLLSNPDFEVAETNSLFGAKFDDWSFGSGIAIETQDVYSGTQAFRRHAHWNKRLTCRPMLPGRSLR